MNRLVRFIAFGPARPWWLTPLLLVGLLFQTLILLRDSGWWWLLSAVPVPLVAWWMAARFAEVAHYQQMRQRRNAWSCPVCRYPLGKLTRDHDPREHPCPECGSVPERTLSDAHRKLERASRWW